MVDHGSPPTPTKRDANAHAPILVIASHYQQIIKAMHTLDDAITPFTTHWPLTQREGPRHVPQTDYRWFCDYLGDAITPIGFAIVGGKRGGDVAALLHEIRDRLQAGREEFSRLEQRIAKEQQAGRMNTVQTERVLSIFKEIMAHTLMLMHHIEHYRSPPPAPAH